MLPTTRSLSKNDLSPIHRCGNEIDFSSVCISRPYILRRIALQNIVFRITPYLLENGALCFPYFRHDCTSVMNQYSCFLYTIRSFSK